MNKYKEKVIKLVDLIETETGLIMAYNDYMSAISDLDIALARLEASALITPDKWFIEKKIYRPDLTSISNAIDELIRRKAELLENEDSPKSLPEHKGSEEMPSVTVNTSAIAVVEMKKETPTGILYAVQVGSFKRKHYAEEMREKLVRKIEEKRVQIHSDVTFYKVRIIGFESKEDAAKLVDSLGINNYLIIKSTNGH